ncbi:MAG: dihydrolipoyl dehydrogenase [Labilithrix sp.]|nr:dihydrolipoyl dehydrogenase [Labilithrix sp.]MCW5814590.1 dihydrolipoyl dehydrogenase [Labilithrix sp.]
MNDTKTVDVAILGAGTAGMAAYRAVRREGRTALLIEAGAYGTTCARVGCMPSKLLIAAADAAHRARHAAPFGVRTTVAVDGKEVMARVRGERDRFVGFVLESIESFPAEDRLLGQARLVGPHTLELTGAHGVVRVNAKAIVVATGSSPWLPPVFDAVKDRIVVNDHVFDWTDLPPSAVVFGAGVIGLELGQALTRLGVKVKVLGRSGTIGPLKDPVVKEAAAKALHAELDADFDAEVRSIAPLGEGTGVAVTFVDKDGNERTDTFSVALVAAGRRPNVVGLGLEHAGVAVDVKVDRRTLRWGSSNVFRAGDVNDDMPLLHEAADEGAIAGTNAARLAAGLAPLPGHRRTPLGIVFSDPNIAVVGGGYPAAEAQGAFVAGAIDFGDQGRSRVMRENHGAARLYANPETRRFLGAELAGPRVEHMAHLLAWAHQARLTVDDMLAMPFYHPVVEEGLRTALRDLASKLPKKEEKES